MRPSPSWAVLNPADPLTAPRTAMVAAEYALWRACQPVTEISDDTDWTTLCTMLTRSTGASRHHITRNLDALGVLDRLPRLRELVESTWLLELRQLRIIEAAAAKAPVHFDEDEYFWEALDTDLMELFTPSRPNQLLPRNKAIEDTVTATIRSVEDQAAPSAPSPWTGEEEPEDAPGPVPCDDPADLMRDLPPVDPESNWSLHLEDLAGGEVRVELIVDQATGTRICDSIAQVAREEKVGQARALVGMILDGVTTTVTTLLYRASDVEDAPVFHPERGLLTEEAAQTLETMVTKFLDMEKAGEEVINAYQVNLSIRSSVIGRDLVCRWPGCNRKATHCDMDHRINHAEGGSTSVANIVALCRHHHNRKTDEQAFYLLDEHTGTVYWLFSDGTYATDEPIGPLAPKNRRWVQTYLQRRARRRERQAAQGAAEKFEAYLERHAVVEDEEEVKIPEPCEPPF